MTALRAPVRPIVAVLPRPGWCTPCAVAGVQRPAVDPRSGSVCRDHLRLLPPRPALPGQPALFDVERVSRLLQAEYPTGVRVACSPCAAAGRDELGLPFRVAEDPTPLCLACWRRREREAGRRGTAAVVPVEWVDDLPAGCPACESPDPSPACWLCGYSWLADARVAHEQLLQAEQAAVDAEFARLAAREQAAERVVWLTGWVSRLRDVVGAYTQTGGGGRGVGWGRAVELLADALARDAAVERSTGRGRPSAYRMVAAVMAVDADYRSGRRAMPGREQCAELAGVRQRAVSNAWKHGVRIGAWICTEAGRRLTLAERIELQRGNNRAVYNLRPVTRSTNPAARDAMIPAALTALDELLAWGLTLLHDAEHHLDCLDTPTQGTGSTPNADTLTVRAGRARLRHAVARTRTTATVYTDHLETANKCTPHTVSQGECVSSCLRGLQKTFVQRPPARTRKRPLRGRGTTDTGASRSPTKGGSADLERCGSVVDEADGTQPVQRPRTTHTGGGASPTGHEKPKRKPPEWADWAYQLAYELQKLWPWLRYQPIHQVAGTLGKRLGPRWTAAAVVDLVTRNRGGRALPVDKHTPVGLLRELIEDALTGDLQPPYPARRRDEHDLELAEQRRAALAAEAETRRAAVAATRAEHAQRGTAAAGARTGGLALVRAALAQTAGGRGAAPAAGPADWAEQTIAPGAGLPAGWKRDRDR